MPDKSLKKPLIGAMVLPEVEFSEDTQRNVEKDLAESPQPPEDQPVARDFQSSSDSCCTGSTASIQDTDDTFASGSNVLKGTKKRSCVSPRMDAITSDVQASPPNNMDEPLFNDQDLTTDNLPERPVVCGRCIQMRTTLRAKIRNSISWMVFQFFLLPLPVAAVGLGGLYYNDHCQAPFNIALSLMAKGCLGIVILFTYAIIIAIGQSPSSYYSYLKNSTLVMIALLRLLMILEESLVFPYVEKSGDCLFLYNSSFYLNVATFGVLFLTAILHYDILIHKCSTFLERETED
ncbi:hypothetical protein NPIL_195282 [Nephila pilipes]|uniref:Uncharacterized protein n=1 Tax=Nephila pilipes TaxID=299642 RepID=A0A8X6T531_NEPPI|nr:hypothetical protein NPIL_195282 [Nephila pilipes]